MGEKLTIEQVCEKLHISRNHWNQMVYRGDAPPRIMVSPRRPLVDEDDLEKWLESRREKTA
ncbi:MAG: helix-turn-helix transcriptional regulator [Protaetiibacter sp.]